MIASHRRGDSRTGAHQRFSASQSNSENGARTNSEWLKPR